MLYFIHAPTNLIGGHLKIWFNPLYPLQASITQKKAEHPDISRQDLLNQSHCLSIRDGCTINQHPPLKSLGNLELPYFKRAHQVRAIERRPQTLANRHARRLLEAIPIEQAVQPLGKSLHDKPHRAQPARLPNHRVVAAPLRLFRRIRPEQLRPDPLALAQQQREVVRQLQPAALVMHETRPHRGRPGPAAPSAPPAGHRLAAPAFPARTTRRCPRPTAGRSSPFSTAATARPIARSPVRSRAGTAALCLPPHFFRRGAGDDNCEDEGACEDAVRVHFPKVPLPASECRKRCAFVQLVAVVVAVVVRVGVCGMEGDVEDWKAAQLVYGFYRLGLVWGLVASRAFLSAFLILLLRTFWPFFAIAPRNRNSVVLLTIMEFRLRMAVSE